MFYFDLHCDTPYKAYINKGEPLAVRVEDSIFFDNWKQCFAIWIADDTPEPFELYRAVLNNYKGSFLDLPDNLTPILTVEGGALLQADISRVDILKSDGVKVLTLTWNGENCIAGGVSSNTRLTDFGKAAVRKLNTLKIACDLSHLNDNSFFDVIDIAEYPIATHSCCRALCDNKRNLTDRQLKLISERGGIIGVCFYPVFLGTDNAFEGIYRHICHMLDLSLEDSIALGSDFDGADMSPRLCNTAQIPDLYEFLYSKNISSNTLNKIFYKNADKFFDNL